MFRTLASMIILSSSSQFKMLLRPLAQLELYSPERIPWRTTRARSPNLAQTVNKRCTIQVFEISDEAYRGLLLKKDRVLQLWT